MRWARLAVPLLRCTRPGLHLSCVGLALRPGSMQGALACALAWAAVVGTLHVALAWRRRGRAVGRTAGEKLRVLSCASKNLTYVSIQTMVLHVNPLMVLHQYKRPNALAAVARAP